MKRAHRLWAGVGCVTFSLNFNGIATYVIALTVTAVALLYCPAVYAQVSVNANREVARAVLVKEFARNPRALSIAQSRAFALRHGLAGSQVEAFVSGYAKTYDEQFKVNASGHVELPKNVRVWRDLSKLTLQLAITRYIGSAGAGEVAKTLLDAAVDEHLENYVAGNAVEFAGQYLAERKFQAAVNVEKLTEYVLSTDGIRAGLVQDIGVDIGKSADQLFEQHPDVAAVFLARNAVTGVAQHGRTLLDIVKEMETLDANDSTRAHALKGELLQYIQEGFAAVNAQVGDGMASLSEQQRLRLEALMRGASELQAEIGNNRRVLGAFIADQVAREKRRQELEQAAAEAERKAATLRGYFQAGTSLLNALEPGLGDKASAIANTSMQIADAVKAFQAAESVDFGSVVALATGIANPAMAVFAIMSQSGPSPEQVILEQLEQISAQITSLRAEMSQRFDIVDSKLDRILSETAGGFDLVSRKLDVNLQAIAASVQIGIDSQALLLSESTKLGAAIRDSVLVPCVSRASSLPLPDESFIVCASQLQNYAATGIERDQVVWNASFSPEFLAGLLQVTDGSTTDILKHEFARRSKQPLPEETVPAAPAWTTAANWYGDFLTADLAQSRRTQVVPRFDTLVDGAERILALRRAVLDSLKGYPRDTPAGDLPSLGANYHPAVYLLDRGAATRAAVAALVTSTTEGYFAAQEFRLVGVEKAFDELDGSPGVLPESRGIRLPDDVVAALVERLPPSLRAAARGGVGKLTLDVEFRGTATSRKSCGVFGLEGEIIFRFDEYVARLSFDAAPKVGLPSQQVASLAFRYPLADGNIANGCGAFATKGPHFCVSTECVGTGVTAALSSLNLTPIPEAQLHATWDRHRNAIADRILAELDLPRVQGDVNLENAYFGGLVRFALADALASDDGLFALAQGRVGIPAPGEFARRIRDVRARDGDAVAMPLVWTVDQYMQGELLSLHDYFSGGALERAVALEEPSVEVSTALAKLTNAGLVLEGAPPAPGETPKQGVSGGGSGCSTAGGGASTGGASTGGGAALLALLGAAAAALRTRRPLGARPRIQ